MNLKWSVIEIIGETAFSLDTLWFIRNRHFDQFHDNRWLLVVLAEMFLIGQAQFLPDFRTTHLSLHPCEQSPNFGGDFGVTSGAMFLCEPNSGTFTTMRNTSPSITDSSTDRIVQ
jgi:hypothetical protein